MPFAFLTGDLPTHKLIVQLKAENPVTFEKITPILGAFHQQMSYMYSLYKRFKGSGMADTLVEAGVVVGGSVDAALRGKHYRRGVRCIILSREALIHLRLKSTMRNQILSPPAQEALSVLRDPLNCSQQQHSTAYQVLSQLDEIKTIVEAVYEKPGTDMGDYWISFLEMSDPLAQNIHACHTQDYDEYISSSYEMLSGLLAYNNHEYGRNLPDFWAMLLNLPEEQTRFLSVHFAHSLTGLPYSCQPMDLWIEVTMNLGSSLKAGWLNLLQNDKQLVSTIRNANNIRKIRQTLESNLKSIRKRSKHVDCQPARLKIHELAIQDILLSLAELKCDLFDLTNPTLRSIQYGIKASEEVALDLRVTLSKGKDQVNIILDQRIFYKTLKIIDRLPNNKRMTFDNNKSSKKGDKAISQAQMERVGLASMIGLLKNTLAADIIFENRVTEECLSIFNVDGSFRRTAKHKLLDHLNLQPTADKPALYYSLIDMSMLFRLATPTPEDREKKKRDGSVYKWIDYVSKIASMVHSRHPDAVQCYAINDDYETEYTIRDDERERRAADYPDAGEKNPETK